MTIYVLFIILASWRDPFPIKVGEFDTRPQCEDQGRKMNGIRFNDALVEQWECIALHEDRLGNREEMDEK